MTQLVTLDFETYFDADYTLSKLTTEEYIRGSRYKTHCVGVKLGEAAGCYLNISLGLSSLLNKSSILAHHAQFDGLILSHHYNIKPAFWFDTLSMARLVFPHAKSHSLASLAQLLKLPEKTVPYESFKGVRDLPPELYKRVANGCLQDVELTHEIFTNLLPHVPRAELRLIDLTIRLFTEPSLVLDAPRMQDYLFATAKEKEDLLVFLGVTKADLQSSERFAGLLRALGVVPPLKVSPTNSEKMIYAFSKTDDAMKELLEDADERVATLVAARLGQKSTIGETRAQRMLDMYKRGPLSVYLRYCGAHTTRWSGGDALNWQNFPRSGEIRKAIIAPGDYSLVVIDAAQIECRVLNWLAGQVDILDAFASGRDLYSEGGTRLYGRTITKADKVERHLSKALELGAGFGMGWEKFQLTCRRGALGGPPIILDDAEAKRAIQSYRKSHSKVTQLWKYADTVLRCLFASGYDFEWGPMQVKGQKIILPNGVALDYSHIFLLDGEYHVKGRKGATKIYGAKLVENVVQALARVILGQAMLEIAKHFKVVMTTHDELVYLCKTEDAPQALAFGMQVMKTPPAWCSDLPLSAEGGFDVCYSK